MKTVLLVEDELIIGFGLAEALVSLGYKVVGPVPDLAAALAHAREANLAGAVIDVQLGRDEAYPIADLLRARGVPFLFTTGRPAWSLPQRFHAAPVLSKPFEPADVAALAASTFGEAAGVPKPVRPGLAAASVAQAAPRC